MGQRLGSTTRDGRRVNSGGGAEVLAVDSRREESEQQQASELF